MTQNSKRPAREEAPAEAGESDVVERVLADRNRQATLERAGIGLRAQPPAREDAQPVWVDGVPTKHHAKEWFIAETTFGDRVVLTALPEEYAYDFKTADETYIKADRIKRWMPFPDSQYRFPRPAPDALRVAVEGIDADYMTSKMHHPDYVLIPTAKFDAICAALQKENFK